MNTLIQIGKIVAPHGIKGMVKINAFLEKPSTFAAYAPIVNHCGHVMDIQVISIKGNLLIAQINGVRDRNKAQELKGTDLFIQRKQLPPMQENSFYFCDLVGMRAFDEDGRVVGILHSVHNYGASDIFEIKPDKGETILLVFNSQTVLNINTDKKTLIVRLPVAINEGKL